MNRNNTRISTVRCHPLEGNLFSLTLTLTGAMPEKVDYLKDLKQVRELLSAFGLKFWEKLQIIGNIVVTPCKKFIKVVLTVQKTTPTFEELPFFGLNHEGKGEISEKLRATNFTDAAIVAAEYAIANMLAGVTACYMQGNHKGMVRIVNLNIYKKISSHDKRVEKFIGSTGCVLLKGFY